MTCVYYVLICYLHSFALFSFFAAHWLIIQLYQVRQIFDDELPIHWVLSDWIVTKPKNFEFRAPHQVPYFEKISYMILPQVELRQILIMLKVFERGDLVQ